MSPTEKDIKVIALARLLQDRTSYIKEVKEKKEQIEQFKKQKEEETSDMEFNLANEEIILQETEDLIPLVEDKIKEIALDLRASLNGESNEVIDRLLAEADALEKKE